MLIKHLVTIHINHTIRTIRTIPFEARIGIPVLETNPFEAEIPSPHLDVSSVATDLHITDPSFAIPKPSSMATHAISENLRPLSLIATETARHIVSPGMDLKAAFTKPVHVANTSVHFADPEAIMHRPVQSHDFLPIVTPFVASAWMKYLQEHDIFPSFLDVPYGIQYGFDMGVHSLPATTYVPPNHSSALTCPLTILSHIQKELSLHRYTGPFSQSRLELLIGPFRCCPLGLVPKTPGSLDEFRLVQDFSYPRNNPDHLSVNSEINIDDFRCDWGTFFHVASIVMDAPLFTEAATLDVDAAFRRCPIRPSQQPNFVIMWNDLFYIDHNAPFGAASSGGVFGHVADALMAIFRARDIGPAVNWVDDFLFFRLPINLDFINDDVHWQPLFSYNLDTIFSITLDLGWPWKDSKTRPFSTTFRYLGFHWDLSRKTVEIPDEKKERYSLKLGCWISGKKFTRRDIESILGTLSHCSLALPIGRCHLPSLYRFAASFTNASSPFVKKMPNQSVLSDIAWWREQLSLSFCGSSISRPPLVSPVEFWVDASTDWGVGVVFNNIWDSWRLKGNWKSNGRDIGWAEFIAIELGLLLAISCNFSDTHFLIRSDNQGVIDAIKGGKSRNPQQNIVLRRILLLLSVHSLHISSLYVTSNSNLADRPSRGLPILDLPRFSSPLSLPADLLPFIARADTLRSS